ncbi:uncharacterized protein [Venturia canescens]|uniref:uncharacterized protein n=1 Tax=Venturia canescens TaxID=32260 RepID=UPI001C9CCC37|nr:uncharacterized protein LOC122411659 [Venturia canescens]
MALKQQQQQQQSFETSLMNSYSQTLPLNSTQIHGSIRRLRFTIDHNNTFNQGIRQDRLMKHLRNNHKMASLESSIDETNTVDIEEEALAGLRALENALDRRIEVRTSLIKLVPENETNRENGLLDVDGVITDEKILAILEESVSDIINTEENESVAFGGSHEASTLRNELPTDTSASALVNAQNFDTVNLNSRDDGSFYSLPSCCSIFDGIVSTESLKQAERVIADLEANGPAGLVHLSSLSATIQKPIRVWMSDSENSRKVGKTRTAVEPINIEYHEPGPDDIQGHWTLRGNVEPRDNEASSLNDCLFSVVADQIGHVVAPELRKKTIAHMRQHSRSLAHRIKTIAKKEKCERIALLVGGARYNGTRPQDAKRIIDASQQGRCHPGGLSGHPRGHASHPAATGPTESVENYSRGSWKSGFLSRQDQDAVGHLVLQSQQAQSAMDKLNAGSENIAIRVDSSELEPGALPEAAEWVDGQPTGPTRAFRQLVMVLRHHAGKKNDPDADVFVHTFYPVVK